MVGMNPQRAFSPIHGLLERGAIGHLTDGQLLELFSRKRDADIAFEALVLRHGPAVLCTCRMVLGDRGEADDAFQATFLVLARRAGSLRLAESVGPWLQGVVRRISLKARMAAIRRRVHERRSAVSILLDPKPRVDFSETLREAVGRLPEKFPRVADRALLPRAKVIQIGRRRARRDRGNDPGPAGKGPRELEAAAFARTRLAQSGLASRVFNFPQARRIAHAR